MDYFNPEETSPDASTHNYTGTLAHRMTLGQSTAGKHIFGDQFRRRRCGGGARRIWRWRPAGTAGIILRRSSARPSASRGLSAFSFAPLNGLGTHHFKIGLYVASSEEDGRISENPVDILDAAGQLTRRISFPRDRQFEISDIEQNFFAQDHWIVSPRLSLDLGTRVESQEVSGAFRVAPRAGLAWNPIPGQAPRCAAASASSTTACRSTFTCSTSIPDQVVTYYDAAGNISGGAVPLPEHSGPGEGPPPVHFSGADRRQLLAAQHQLDDADGAAGGALPEAADRIHAEPVGRPGDSQPGSARPGDQPGSAPAIAAPADRGTASSKCRRGFASGRRAS